MPRARRRFPTLGGSSEYLFQSPITTRFADLGNSGVFGTVGPIRQGWLHISSLEKTRRWKHCSSSYCPKGGQPQGQPRAGPNAGRRVARTSLAPSRAVPSKRGASPPCDGRCRKLSRSHAPQSRRLPSGVALSHSGPSRFFSCSAAFACGVCSCEGASEWMVLDLGEEPVCPEPRPPPRLLRAGT